MALHTDEPHPHVHVVIKAVSEQGERLNIRKATLSNWREEFASQLRLVGVAANATPRQVRGETRPRKSDGIFRAAKRGASTHIRERVEAAAAELRNVNRPVEPAKLQLLQTRREVESGWHATIEALKSQGQTALAEQTRRFADGLPPVRTEREWLMAGLVEQARSRRAQESEMIR
jgi:L-lysine 2,3-aminomutase